MIPQLHLVTDARVLSSPRFLAAAGEAVEAGGARVAVHLRGPDADARELWERGRELLPVVRDHGARLLVNDRVDLAVILDADGVQLPEHGLPVGIARELMKNGTLVGRSVHGPRSFAPGGRPDFLLVGTLFPTPSHPDRAGAGPGRVEEAVRTTPHVPAVGIGGITLERVPAVIGAGAHGVAVLRAVWEHPKPGDAVEAFLAALEGGRAGRGVGDRAHETNEEKANEENAKEP
ncbi:MAG: thiamine phosphate synthase [bacterium]